MAKIAMVLDHGLMNYRVSLMRGLSEKGHDLTVCTTHSTVEVSNLPWLTISYTPSVNICGFQWRQLPDLSNYQVIIFMQNLRIANLWIETLNPFRHSRMVHWGIGVSSDGGLPEKTGFVGLARNMLALAANAQILYSPYPLQFFWKVNREKTWIAHNTIENLMSQDLSSYEKDSFLFIGSINKRKGLSVLLKAFADYLIHKPNGPINRLIIAGDGPEHESILKETKILDIERSVELVGNVADGQKKMEIMKRSIASISPKQAGLSVLECFSYGVPFITFDGAITGGERLNIIPGQTGFVVNSESELVKAMISLAENPEYARTLGKNAFKLYSTQRRMEHMVDVFDEVVRSVMR